MHMSERERLGGEKPSAYFFSGFGDYGGGTGTNKKPRDCRPGPRPIRATLTGERTRLNPPRCRSEPGLGFQLDRRTGRFTTGSWMHGTVAAAQGAAGMPTWLSHHRHHRLDAMRHFRRNRARAGLR